MQEGGRPQGTDRERWQREAEFFDAEEYSSGPIAPAVVERYLALKRPWLKPEFRFHALGDVSGKRILEIGCGDGGNAIILGLRGAHVVGVDVSPKAIEIATDRAKLHGLSDRVRFLCSPLELLVQSRRERYDIVCGFAVLHHVLPALDSVLGHLQQLTHPTSQVMFGEPVSTWTWLRKVRLMVPIPVSGTDDERPLNAHDLAVIGKYWPKLNQRYFGASTRLLDRVFPLFENMSSVQRVVYSLAARCDDFFLNSLGIHGLGSYVVVHAPAPRPSPVRD